jgi:hypothetical protein
MMLWRTFIEGGESAPLKFVMLNPSTADADTDDATIRRCMGFAKREKAGGILVVNLSPWRATDPADLDRAYRRGEDVLYLKGRDGNRSVIQRARAGGPFILAWGAGIRPWMREMAEWVITEGGLYQNLCLGKTKEGEPRHPLMLPRDAKLEPFYRGKKP